jgi:hypothetical protein
MKQILFTAISMCFIRKENQANSSSISFYCIKKPFTVNRISAGIIIYYGVDPSDGAALYVSANTATASGKRIITNKDGLSDTVTTLASNGKFDYQGSAIPNLYGSFTQSFTWKQLTLSALFTFQVGGKTFDATYQGLMSSGTYGGALSTDILKRWQQPGDITNVPRLDAGRTTDFNATSSRWLVDASYINIRSVNLSLYTA